MREISPRKDSIRAAAPQPQSRLGTCLCALAAALLVLAGGCKGTGQGKTRQSVLGMEPVPDVTLVAAPSGALLSWCREGSGTARTLVHFGRGSGLAYLAPEKTGELRTLVKEKKWDEIEKRRDTGPRGLVTSDNYINAAAQLGLVDEVYWIIPFKYAQYFNAEGVIKKMLADSEAPFRKQDIDAMRFSGGCVSGRLFGVKTHICSPETFPPVRGPVKVDMGVEFLAEYAVERRQATLRGFKEFLDEIKKRGLGVSGVVVALPEDSGSPLAMRSYLGPQMVEALKDVKLLDSSTPPELWSARNDADSLFSEGRFADLAQFLKGARKKFPKDAPLLAYEGVALALLGRTAAAAKGLGGLCGKSGGECAPLLVAAAALEEHEKPAAAEMFITQALKVRPDWPEALLALGNLHFRQERYGKALAAYEGYARHRDSLAARLRLGDCLFLLGRKKEAADQYARGIGFVTDMTGSAEISRNWESLNRSKDLFRELGSAELAEKARRVLARG